MLVICPQCSTQYNVPLTALPPTGRKTRCASCGHVWLEGAPPAEAITAFAAADAVPTPPAAVIEPPSNIQPAPPKAKKPAKPRKPFPWAKVAAGLAFVFVTVTGGGLIFRESIAKATPGLLRVYEMVGMPVGNVDDWFKRTNLKADPFAADGQQGLKIMGEYQNTSPLKRTVPHIKIFWQTKDGKVASLISATASPLELEPNETASFSATLAGIDMSAGGQLGAVLEGGRYDEQLVKLLAADGEATAKPATSHEAAAPEEKPPAEHAPKGH